MPVYNEAAQVRAHVERLRRWLDEAVAFTAEVTVVDNASTDDTMAIVSDLASSTPGITAVHLERKGRGGAIRQAWMRSDATVVAYMDVDLSTDLAALGPLVEPLLRDEHDLAVGSRRLPGSQVSRGARRELISRGYLAIAHVALGTRITDLQCGFKAMRTKAARDLLPEVADDEWFFDTELLVLAERRGLRITEVPVTWVDDPDTRVRVLSTAWKDLQGVERLRRRR